MRIFSCHHLTPARLVDTPLFKTYPLPIEQRGPDEKPSSRAQDNRLSEMRHQFQVWQSGAMTGEMVGFEHYRRLFLLTGANEERIAKTYPDVHQLRRDFARYGTHHFLVNQQVFDQYLDYRESLSDAEVAELEAYLSSFDIVTVRPDQRSLLEALYYPTWDIFEGYVKQTRFFREAPDLPLVPPHQCYWLNCYILKRDIFEEYMSFAFEAIDIFEEGLGDTLPNQRFFGHVTERLFSIFLYRKRVLKPHLKVLELPTIWYNADLDPNRPAISHDWRFDIGMAEKRGRTATAAG